MPGPAPAHCKPFLTVKPLRLLAVQRPALAAQQDMQAPIAEPPTLVRQFAQPRPQSGIVRTPGSIAHGAPVRRNDGARPPLAHLEARPQMGDGFPPVVSRKL
jgi:hypothetical protein